MPHLDLQELRQRLAVPALRADAVFEICDHYRGVVLSAGAEFETACNVAAELAKGLWEEWGFIVPMDIVRYPVEWNALATEVKEAAGWECQECGRQCRKPNEAHVSHKFTLTVAHLMPDDHAPDAPEVFVAALCAPCHLRIDNERRAASGKPRKF